MSVVVDDEEPSAKALADAAVLHERDGELLYSYRCPLHGADHTVAYSPAFARQYLAAAGDETCCCPAGMGWSVRHGLARARLLAWLLAVLWIANALDLVLTLKAIALGKATEMNGVMGAFLKAGSAEAVAFKLGVVTAGVVALWLARRRGIVLPLAVGLAGAFVGLVVYEALSLLLG